MDSDRIKQRKRIHVADIDESIDDPQLIPKKKIWDSGYVVADFLLPFFQVSIQSVCLIIPLHFNKRSNKGYGMRQNRTKENNTYGRL